MFFIALTTIILLITLRLAYTGLKYITYRQFYLELAGDEQYDYQELLDRNFQDADEEFKESIPILIILGVSAVALHALNNGIIGALLWH